MLIQFLLALIIGIFTGTLTGLFPGIHINLVAATLLSSLGYFSGIEPIVLVVFVVAMAITHTFIDFIPSIFLGAPEEDSFLAVLPGHKLLKNGKGHEAVVLTLLGSLISLPVIILFAPIFIKILPMIYDPMRIFIPYLLIFISLFLIFREEEFLISLTVFILAGFLGLFTFNLPVKEPLLPLLTGLFGASGLIISLKNKTQIPEQKIIPIRNIIFDKKEALKSISIGSLVSAFSSFLPGIGAGHSAVISSELIGKSEEDNKTFLFLVGLISTVVMGLSFVTAYTIQKTRTGAAVAIQRILEEISFSSLMIILITITLTGIIAFFLGIKISKIASQNITKINYTKVSYIILFILIGINLLLSNIYGLLVLLTATSLGVFTILSSSRRINLMGALLIPTIVYYLSY